MVNKVGKHDSLVPTTNVAVPGSASALAPTTNPNGISG
jgi:hypothetical protein